MEHWGCRLNSKSGCVPEFSIGISTNYPADLSQNFDDNLEVIRWGIGDNCYDDNNCIIYVHLKYSLKLWRHVHFLY